MPLDISLVQVLDAHSDGVMQDVHVACPGTIVSWSSGTATVQPTVRKPLQSADDVLVFETLPQIANVPCFVQASGGFICSMPYAQGDPVFLIFSEQSYAEYLATGQVSNPKDLRRHGVGYPYAIPGPRPASQALSSIDPAKMIVGRDGQAELITIGAGQLDLGSSGATFLTPASAISDLQSAINGWTPVSNDGGAALKVALTTWIGKTYSTTLVKAK